ncbi:arsenic resistance protein [Pseudopedobacter beijingensis]|uniref:Arsenic resistance protein n=1 Tax=Pseudopedobacter beijingensis TaxID=1207056 RepID=A0ABW4IE75_9SPHI
MITREQLEEKQINIYIIVLIISVIVGINWSNSSILSSAIESVIGLLLYGMFCQIPFLELGQVFKKRSFFKALLLGNFVLIPLLVWLLISLFSLSSSLQIGVLLVLLTPCIDYVIVFTHLGKGDARAILAATPLLFLLQLILLPLYLWFFLGKETIRIIEISPFVQAFVFLILLPFLLSVFTQWAASGSRVGKQLLSFSGWLPVPLMALTFFVVITSQIAVLYARPAPIFAVIPVYICFALLAPFAGMAASAICKTDDLEKRAVAFSTSTRNSLVVLPLALSLPAPENQLVAAVIVTQTIVEIFFELIYIKIIPRIIPGKKR